MFPIMSWKQYISFIFSWYFILYQFLNIFSMSFIIFVLFLFSLDCKSWAACLCQLKASYHFLLSSISSIFFMHMISQVARLADQSILWLSAVFFYVLILLFYAGALLFRDFNLWTFLIPQISLMAQTCWGPWICATSFRTLLPCFWG